MRILLFSLLLYGHGLFAQSAEQQLNSFLDNLHSLKAHFIQKVSGEEGESYSRGTLYLQRPNHLRWQYEGEEGQIIIADGRRLWLIEPDLQQVSQKSQKKALQGSIAQVLLQDQLDLRSVFEVESLPDAQGYAWLQLKPKQDTSFDLIKIGLQQERLERIELWDQLGQRTQLHFYDLERNPQLDPQLFRFQPPPGYDLLEQSE